MEYLCSFHSFIYRCVVLCNFYVPLFPENDTVPVLRSASLALTDAAEELNRMRTDTNRDRSLLSSTLAEACAGNDINTVRRLLGDGTNTINEGTDDGESLLSLACSAGYYELAQVISNHFFFLFQFFVFLLNLMLATIKF